MGEIVRLDENDAEQVHELLKITWRDTYTGILPDSVIVNAETVWHSAETLRRQMRNRDILFAGYKEVGKLLGMARVAMVDGDSARVFQLYVLPGSQRRGIGTKLMNHSRETFPAAKRFVLDVSKGNEKGIAFCRRYGFRFGRESTIKLGDQETQNLEGVLEVSVPGH
ncbi:MAG: GNAT family N-acetyltransferase [Thaumarchaeota archaeon]|nr:GNAT family N-acetyltransferase [Nitrososphaerota archaeon]